MHIAHHVQLVDDDAPKLVHLVLLQELVHHVVGLLHGADDHPRLGIQHRAVAAGPVEAFHARWGGGRPPPAAAAAAADGSLQDALQVVGFLVAQRHEGQHDEGGAVRGEEHA